MKKQRRDVLTALTATAGVALLPSLPAQTPAAESSATATQPKSSPATARAGVDGIGGFFFRARDPKALAQWYHDHLGITPTPQQQNDPVWQQAAGPTVFAPFPEKTSYFGDPERQWMINFRVRDLARLIEQLRADGIEVKQELTADPNGHFARIHDPEGNPIELWQPAPKPATA